MNENITEDEWQSICLKAQTQTINTKFKLIQYKWIMRVYITPELLHTFNPNIPDQCIKCNLEIGTLYHCLRECPQVQHFWEKVLDFLITGFETKCS